MSLEIKIPEIQRRLAEQKIDGWLLYDNHGSNAIAMELLEIPSSVVLTRRFFYWIPKAGEPIAITHTIEAHSLDMLPGQKRLYLSWLELEKELKKILKGVKRIAMEYSPRNLNPYVSAVDAGTMEMVREFVDDVVSSQDLLQHFTSVLDEAKIALHKEAAHVLITVADKAFEHIAERIQKGKQITEYDVQQFIQSEFLAHGCITEGGPICAVNEHSALPHYMASKESAKTIGEGDFILIDLWCKRDLPHAVYADITRVAVAASEPTPRQQQIFEIVQTAQERAFEFVRAKMHAGEVICGYEVDDVARSYITEQGYGPYFTHRLGHNIDTHVHGTGAHLDNLETSDQRQILPGTCFSIEPGIYLPDEFGVRLEYDVIVYSDSHVEISGGVEKRIHCLL